MEEYKGNKSQLNNIPLAIITGGTMLNDGSSKVEAVSVPIFVRGGKDWRLRLPFDKYGRHIFSGRQKL